MFALMISPITNMLSFSLENWSVFLAVGILKKVLVLPLIEAYSLTVT